MKIEGETQTLVPGVSEWVSHLCECSSEDFIKELQSLEAWPFQRLDDLSSIARVLDRIDTLLTEGISSHGYPLLELLLDKTILILSSVTHKSLYNSLDCILSILDFFDWSLIYKALQVIHLLVNRVTPVIKATKAHSSQELCHKLYVIGLGSNLNCPSPVNLQLLCSSKKVRQLDFQYIKNDEEVTTSCINIPEDLQYVWINRQRMNRAIENQALREKMVACQLLSLSSLMQIPPELQTLQDFSRSLPELWLLPAVSEILKMPISSEVHIQAINLLSGILVMTEGQSIRHELSQNHLITSTQNLLAAWQQHGLMQTLLRDISSNTSILPESTAQDNTFISALLHLASIVADYKYRVDSSHVPGMTCSLLMLLQNCTFLTLQNMAKAVRILSVIVSHSIDMFKEIGGLDTVLTLLTKEIYIYYNNPDPARAYLIRALFRLLKIVITKWDPSHTLNQGEVHHVLYESGLLESLKKVYEMCYYEVYEPSLQLLCCFVNFSKQIIDDLICNGTIQILLQSLEGKLPNNAKLVGVVTRFLCSVALNHEGNKIIEGFSTVERLLEALGSTNGVVLTADLAENIGENMQILMSNVPAVVNKAVDGCILLISSIQNCNTSIREVFFPQLTNIGKLISTLLGFSPELVKGFIEQGGLDGFLSIFKMPVQPLTFNNEFHGFAACVKSIPSSLTVQVLSKVLDYLSNQLDAVENYIGPLESLADFSQATDTKTLTHLLTGTDSFIELVRFLIQNGGASNIELLCTLLYRLSHYMRILIAEQARLSPFSKANTHTTKNFNQPIDIKEIENVALKSFEENFYFTCQLTVRKLYRFTTRMSSARGRLAITEDSGIKISKTMGGILAYLIKLINLDNPDQYKAYYYCLQLSDILKILLQDQNSNPATLYTFYLEGGTEHVYKFLLQLREISKSLINDEEKSYDLVNSMQILWNLCGRFLESLSMGRFSTTSAGVQVLRALGCESSKEINKKMQTLALEYLTGLNFLECGVYSTAFARSALEILKTFSDVGKASLDSDLIKNLTNMGFSEQSIIQASRATGSCEIDKIMDYLIVNKDHMPMYIEESVLIENLHYILISSLPFIPTLRSSVADVLAKICLKPNAPFKDIALMLLLQIGILANRAVRESTLLDAMLNTLGMDIEKSQRDNLNFTNSYKAFSGGSGYLELLDIPTSFEHLGACIHVLSALVSKSPDILEIIHSYKFTSYAINLMEAFATVVDPVGLGCLSPLFSLLDTLSRFSADTDIKLTLALCNLINTHKNTPIPEQPDLHSLLQVLTSLTANPKNAKIFMDSKALNILLTLRIGEGDEKLKNNINVYGILLKQLVEDPYLLQGNFEISIIQNYKKGIELKEFLNSFSPQITRSKEVFKAAFENTCIVVKKNAVKSQNRTPKKNLYEERQHVSKFDKMVVELKKDRKEITGEKWKAVSIICLSLCEVCEGEQKGQEFMIPSQCLVSILAEIFQSYPVLIKEIINQTAKHNKKFLPYLIRNIIPFRYSLQLVEGKVIFNYPGTKNQVSPEIYQNWVKVTSKLIKSLTFKQASKHQNSSVVDICNLIFLDNNLPVLKARKRIFKELKSMLLEQTKKPWFGNEKSMAIVRSVVIIIMQLLREVPKSPFTSNNPAEIARTLVSEQFSMIKLLSDAAKGVKINFKKAGSMLNLILAPLELLTKYNISFTLHLSKPNNIQEPEEVIEEPMDEDLGKFEIYEEGEFDGEESSSNPSQEQVGEEEEGDDMMDEDSDSENQVNIEQDLNEEEDDEDLLEESDQVEENLEGIVVEGRNTEAFWAEDLEEETDPASNVWINNRQNEEFVVERHIIDQRFQGENEEGEPWSGIRDIRDFPIHWDRVEGEEAGQFINFVPEIDGNDNELWMMFMRRNRLHIDGPERNTAKPRTEDTRAIEELYLHFTKTSNDIQDPEPDPQTDTKSFDPTFLAAMPDDIRIELLQQRPSAIPNLDSEISEEFLSALPEELRAEILPSHLPRIGISEEMDNATFIASLTPDLRREILITANEELLASLTPELVAEARVLQERVISRRHARIERPSPPKPLEDGKEISEIVNDEKLTSTLAQVEDSFLEVLIKGIYLLNPINRDILASLLLNLSAQGNFRSKLLDALLCLLLQFGPGKDFPPQRLYGSETYLENYSQVYAIVTGRILDLLIYLAEKNPKVPFEMLVGSKSRLPLIKILRGNEELRGFSSLLSLTQHKLFETSSSHLNPLISLISRIIEKQAEDVPGLDDAEIQQICTLLSYESLSDTSVKSVIELVTCLAQNINNKVQIERILYSNFCALGKEIASNLTRLETSADGQKELQLLRVFKVYKGISKDNRGLEGLWGPLTEALNIITQRDSDFASTASPTLSKLLPVIETFFLAHVNTSHSECFQKFCDRNRKVLNILIKQNPSLLQDTLHTLVSEFPALLDFENKRAYFRAEIRKLRPDRAFDTIRLQVRRSEVFMDSYHQLKVRTPAEMHGKLRVTFIDEDGVDAGGLTREWYELLAREMFNPNYALFIPSANGVSFQPNCMSYINIEHLEFFKFIGRIIGKALCDGFSLDLYFTRSFYKHILGQEVTYHDMEDLDPDFYKNLKSLMDINLNENDIHEYYFAYEEEEFGTLQLKELEPGGMQKRVTEENKMEYIKLICHMKMTQNIREQIKLFLEGFHELIPKPMIAIFDSKELELLIAGLPEIDIEDLKNNTEYHNYTKDSPVIVWLWELLYEFSHEERAEFMQFVTGSSKVPLEGFKALPGMSGVQKFQIHKSFTGPDRLPTAHTCMNQIDLPDYPTKEILRDRIKLTITEGKEGFGFI